MVWGAGEGRMGDKHHGLLMQRQPRARLLSVNCRVRLWRSV